MFGQTDAQTKLNNPWKFYMGVIKHNTTSDKHQHNTLKERW